MDILIKASQLILSLSILVILHELGHFIPARLFKTRVEKFYLFFDPWFSLFKKKVGNTEYGVGWLPLGGYVKISGMIDESMDKEQMKKDPEPWEFRAKPAWQRLIIMLGGVFVNLILGIVIYTMVLFVWGKEYIPVGALNDGMVIHDEFKIDSSSTINKEWRKFQDGDNIISVDGEVPFDVTEVNKMILLRGARKIKVRHQNGVEEIVDLPNNIDDIMFQKDAMRIFSPRVPPIIGEIKEDALGDAKNSDLEEGDLIVSINDTAIYYWDNLVRKIQQNKNKKVKVGYKRNGVIAYDDIEVDGSGILGVQIHDKILSDKIQLKKYSFLESIPAGWNEAIWSLSDYASQFKFVFTSKGVSSLGGFGTIGGLFKSEWNWQSFWSLTAFLSLMLAFMNLLPIPALDGGHVMFLLYEIIAGKPAPEKFMERAQMVGMILLLGLLVFANGQDIYKAIFE